MQGILKQGLVLSVFMGFLGLRAMAENKKAFIVEQKQITRSVQPDTQAELSQEEFAYPSNQALAGTLEVYSAKPFQKGTLTFGIGAGFYTTTQSPVSGGSSFQAQTLNESLFVGYTPLENLSLGFSRKNSSTTFGNPKQLISSLGDMQLSALYGIPLTSFLSVAPFVEFLVASNFNDLAPAGTTLSAGAGMAATWSLRDMIAFPLLLHANIGYHMPEIRENGPVTIAPEVFFNFSRFHTLSWSLAAELPLGSFVPFVEFYQRTFFQSSLSFGSTPSNFRFGSRILPLSNKSLCFTLGGEVGLGKGLRPGVPYNPDYRLLAQLSYSVGLLHTERKHYKTSDRVQIVDRKFVINEKIKFLVNKATLRDESQSLLSEIASVIRDNQVAKLLIVGHTDSTANERYNLKLSKQRAESVRNFLIEQGISKDILLTQGYGKQKPIASNSTEEGRSKNRRVEFFILE